jgi:hypothetical protein
MASSASPLDSKTLNDDETKNIWLRTWGQQLLTLPELLLCPSDARITIFALESNLPKPERFSTISHPESISKRGCVHRAYGDADFAQRVRSLVDHYEGKGVMTPLELIATAFECLQALVSSTIKPYPIGMGEGRSAQKRAYSYTLIGLLRWRPVIDQDDGDFEAFARLTMANDSSQLLERMICLLPKSREQTWHSLKDAWDRPLRDIDPYCQVTGIVDNSTLVLDGAFGVTIRWHSLANMAFLRNQNTACSVIQILSRCTPIWLLIGAIMIARSPESKSNRTITSNGVNTEKIPTSPILIISTLFLTLALVLLLASPLLIVYLYRRNSWSV